MDKRKTSKKKTMLEKKTQGNAQLLGDRDIHACNTNLVYIIYMYIFFFTSKRPSLYHCNSCWLRHRCAPVIVTNITYVGNFTFTVATPAFNTMDPNHHTYRLPVHCIQFLHFIMRKGDKIYNDNQHEFKQTWMVYMCQLL